MISQTTKGCFYLVPHYWEGEKQFDGIGAALVFTESTFGVLFGRNYGNKKVFNEYPARGKIIGIVPPGPKGVGSGYVFDVYQYKLSGKADPDIEGYKDTTTQ